MAKPPVVEDKDLEHVVKVARVSGSLGLRNVAIIYTLFGTAIMPVEACKLTMDDYLKADGSVRKHHIVRAEIAYNGHERGLYWTHKRLTDAIDEYLAWRVNQGIGLGTAGRFRGLDPHSPLFHNGRSAGGFKLTAYLKDGVERESAMVFCALIRRLFAQAGVNGQALSGRRTFAVKMGRLGKDPVYVKTALGLASISAAKAVMKSDPVHMGKIVASIF
jgi:site-specific recombinase XerD